MAKKARKAKTAGKKKPGKAKEGKAAKVAGKKKTPKKAAKGNKPTTAKKAQPKTAPAPAVKRPVQEARAPNEAPAKPAAGTAVRTRDAELRLSPGLAGVAAAAPQAAVPVDDEAKFLAVAGCVDVFFAEAKKTLKPGVPLSDADTMSFFNFDTTSIIAVLGDIREKLHNNRPPLTLTITSALSNKCGAAAETIRKLKSDINGATTRA